VVDAVVVRADHAISLFIAQRPFPPKGRDANTPRQRGNDGCELTLSTRGPALGHALIVRVTSLILSQGYSIRYFERGFPAAFIPRDFWENSPCAGTSGHCTISSRRRRKTKSAPAPCNSSASCPALLGRPRPTRRRSTRLSRT